MSGPEKGAAPPDAEPEAVSPLSQAILRLVAEHAAEVAAEPLPPYVIDAETALADAEAEHAAAQERCNEREAQLAELQERRAAVELEGEAAFEALDEVPAEIGVKLNALTKSIAASQKRLMAERSALEQKDRAVEAKRAHRDKAARHWTLQNPRGPGARGNALLVEFLDMLPAVAAPSIAAHHRARTQFAWQCYHHPLPAWYGPGGAILAAFQRADWPRWPARLNPSWAPEKGKSPSVADMAAGFVRAVNRAAETAKIPEKKEAPCANKQAA